MSDCGWFPLPFFPCLSGNDSLSKNNRKNAYQDLSNGTISTTRSSDEDSPTHAGSPARNDHIQNATTERIDNSYSIQESLVPLNDSPGANDSPYSSFRSAKNKLDFLSMRMNPKLRLLTSSSIRQSSICDDPSSTGTSRGEQCEDEDSEWSYSSIAENPQAFGGVELPTQVFDVGLMITIDEGHCQFHLVPDANYPQIHPNVYAPANLDKMRILYGGGSGVAVFGGHSPDLGDIVMKHGGYKDMQELFALATISEELHKRGEALGRSQQAQSMQDRLPSFRSIYISPHHIRSRGNELVGLLKGFVMNRNWSDSTVNSTANAAAEKTISKIKRASAIVEEKVSEMHLGMTMRIFEGENEDSLSFVLNDSNPEQWKLSLVLPAGSTMFSNSSQVQIHGSAYESVKSVVHSLEPIMTERAFKFTLAQKTIGGPSSKTGNQWLYEGKLSGRVLQNLMDQMILVIHDLESLTLPDEVDAVDEIQKEVLRFEESDEGLRANHITKTADSFVGNAIKKNFHPEKGRQHFLRSICSKFREGALYLTAEEATPARHLGMLLRSGALMSDTFVHSPTAEPTVLQTQPHFWRNILRRAVETRSGISPHALRRLVSVHCDLCDSKYINRCQSNPGCMVVQWTCGLTDAGIHNLFIDENNLFLFDLGEPQLMSLPGFLTKFLFSFFHTLGMEDDGETSWVNRFEVVGDKLALTKESRDLLPKAYDAFETCLDRIIAELLDGDDGMRWLLLEYITMQLMSDTAFCLQKWQIKGGGKKSSASNHQTNQEKWLWRALWDIYIAFDINTAESWCRFGVVHPHFQQSFDPSIMEGFGQ